MTLAFWCTGEVVLLVQASHSTGRHCAQLSAEITAKPPSCSSGSSMSVNWATAELGTTLVDFSSEIEDCEAQNVLESSMNSIWLTEEGLPQWFCLSLAQIQKTRDVVIRTIGWHCWHPYTTNPHIVTVHVSSDGSKFKQWDTFQAASPQRGTQLFCCAPISASIYPFLAFEVTETFGGNQTYLNRLFLYSDEIATSPQISVTSGGYKSTITGGGDETTASKVDRSESSSLNSDSMQSDYVALKKLEKALEHSNNDSNTSDINAAGEHAAGTSVSVFEGEDSMVDLTATSTTATGNRTAEARTVSGSNNMTETTMLSTKSTDTPEVFTGGRLFSESKLSSSSASGGAQQQQQEHSQQYTQQQSHTQEHRQAQHKQQSQSQQKIPLQPSQKEQLQQSHQQSDHRRDDSAANTLVGRPELRKSGGGQQSVWQEGGGSSMGLEDVSNLSIDTLAGGQVHAINSQSSSSIVDKVDQRTRRTSGTYSFEQPFSESSSRKKDDMSSHPENSGHRDMDRDRNSNGDIVYKENEQRSSNQEQCDHDDDMTSSSFERNVYFERSNTGPSLFSQQQQRRQQEELRPQQHQQQRHQQHQQHQQSKIYSNSDSVTIENENSHLKSRLSELESSMKALVTELTQLKASPPAPLAPPPSQKSSFQTHLHQYEHTQPSLSPSAGPLGSEPFQQQQLHEQHLAELGQHVQYSAQHSHVSDPLIAPQTNNSYLSKRNLGQHRPLPQHSASQQAPLPQQHRLSQHANSNFIEAGRASGAECDQHSQAIKTMRQALGEHHPHPDPAPPQSSAQCMPPDDSGNSDDLVRMVQDMEGRFKSVMKRLELKGLLADKPRDATNALDLQNHQNIINSGDVSVGGVRYSNEAYLRSDLPTLTSSQSAHQLQQQQQQQQQQLQQLPAPPLQRGESGRGPGGIFRPQLGGPPPSSFLESQERRPQSLSARGSVDSLSAHTGPVLMRDKGIHFFNAKRNIKSCEKPTPNIGDYLILEDKNCLHSADNVTSAVRGEEQNTAKSAVFSTTAASKNHTDTSSRGNSGSCKKAACCSSSCHCHCATSRQRSLAAELQRREVEEKEVEEEYNEIIRQLEDKVSQRVVMEAQLKVLRFMKKAEKKNL